MVDRLMYKTMKFGLIQDLNIRYNLSPAAAEKFSEELIEKYFNTDRLNDELLISQNLLVNPFKKLCSDLFEYFQPAFTIGLLDIDAGVLTSAAQVDLFSSLVRKRYI